MATRSSGSPVHVAVPTTPSSPRLGAALVAETDEAFMVDAAAVAANFEMMTRLADGTGAAMPAERLERSQHAIETMGVGDLPSRR